MRLLTGLAVASLLLATACTSDKAADLKATDEIVTGSIAQSNAAYGVDPKDAEIIKTRVTSSSLTALSAPLEWKNEESGASGAIMAIETYKGRHGQPCRSFKTTVANFLGVSLFEGETCEVKERSWILSWLKRSD